MAGTHRSRGARQSRAGYFVVAAVLLAPLVANAYSSYGLGTLECSRYLERRGEDQKKATMDNTVFVHAYLSGYLTAGNMMHGLVGDHAKDVAVNVHGVVQWLDAWCLEHPEQRVAESLEHFWVEAAAAKEKLKALGPDAARRATGR